MPPLSCLLQKGCLSLQHPQIRGPNCYSTSYSTLANCNIARVTVTRCNSLVQDTTRNQLLKANLAITFLNLALCYGNVVILHANFEATCSWPLICVSTGLCIIRSPLCLEWIWSRVWRMRTACLERWVHDKPWELIWLTVYCLGRQVVGCICGVAVVVPILVLIPFFWSRDALIKMWFRWLTRCLD